MMYIIRSVNQKNSALIEAVMKKQKTGQTDVSIDGLNVEAAGLHVLLHGAEECGDVVGKLQYKERLEDIANELRGVSASDNELG